MQINSCNINVHNEINVIMQASTKIPRKELHEMMELSLDLNFSKDFFFFFFSLKDFLSNMQKC